LLLVQIPAKPVNYLPGSIRNLSIVVNLLFSNDLEVLTYLCVLLNCIFRFEEGEDSLRMVQIGYEWAPSNSRMLLILSEAQQSRKLVPVSSQIFPKQ